MRRQLQNILTLVVCTVVLMPGREKLTAQTVHDTLKIGEVSVFSARPVEQTAQSITLIDSAMLSHHPNGSLSELISDNSSLFVKSLGRGALATVSSRGTAPSHTKVNWNGLELNSPMLGMVDFSMVPSSFIDEITLVHGNNSLSSMPGAPGGILSMETKPVWKKGVSGAVMQGAGSFGSYDAYGRLNAGNSGFQSGTRIFYDHSDNDFRYRNYDSPDSVNLQTGEKYFPLSVNNYGDYTHEGIMQQFSWRPQPHEMIDFNAWIQRSQRSLPMLTTDESADNDRKSAPANRQHDRFLRTALNYRNYGDKGKFTLFSGINYNLLSYRMENLINGSGSILKIDSDSRVLSFDSHVSYRYSLNPGNEVKIIFRYLNDDVRTEERVTGNGYTKHRGEASLGLSWFGRAGKRLKYTATVNSQLAGGVFIPLSYSLGGEYHLLPGDRLYLRASITSNHRFPSLNDLYFQPGGNPDLRPENSISQEAGIVFDDRLNGKGICLSLTGFHSDVRDWIIWLPAFRGYWEPVNIEKVKTGGLEVNIDYSGNRGPLSWLVRSSYSLTSSRNFGDPAGWADGSFGKQLPYIPLHSATVNGSVDWHGWSVLYTWNYYSERFTTISNLRTSNRDYLYPYLMNQVRIGKKISFNKVNFDTGLSIYNLFNEQYRSVLQRPMPGRNYLFVMRLAW